MSERPPEEAPVYHKSLTPESPRPLHVPSPANIPILENQIEPIFNLISSHTAPPYAARDLTHMDQELAAAATTMNSDIPAQNLDSNEDSHNPDGPVPTNGREGSVLESHTRTDPSDLFGALGLPPNADDAAVNADDSINAIANPSSHAANLSMTTLPETQSKESTLPATSAEAAKENTAAQASVPSLDQRNTAPQDVAVDGVEALLESLTNPPNVQPNPFASAPGVFDEHAAEGQPEPEQNTDTNGQLDSGMALDQPESELQPANLNQDPSQSAQSVTANPINAQVPSSQGGTGAVIPPPPGLLTNTVPGTNGISSLPIALHLQTAGAPGTAPAPGTTSQSAKAGNAGNDARYTAFLDEESVFTAEGAWEKFPHGSRLFVGNLPTETVTKRDVWNIFEKYGKLAQISIKQAYGFVQFMDVAACEKAMNHEQGGRIKERTMHLEVSKPPKTARNTQATADGDRLRDRHRRNRSRSPERRRGQRGGPNRNMPYSDFRDEPRRGRDDYRPGRSPSPRRRGDDYRPGRDRSPDRFYDGRRRSRSPYGRGFRRSSSPRRTDEDDLPLPKRSPRDVPDVQIILLEDVNRPFIDFVVRGFRDEGMRVDVLNMPHVSLDAVIKRQIVEGVLAVCKLTRNEERTGKVPLQVFDRSQGSQNVRFDEYDNLEMQIAAKLAARAKSTAAPPTPTYGASGAYVPPYMQQAQTAQPPALANNPQLQQLINTLDGPALQQLLGAIGQPQGTPTQSTFGHQGVPGQPDMSAMLGSLPSQQQHAGQQAIPQSYQYAPQPQQPSTSQQAAYGYPAGAYQGQQNATGYPVQAYGQAQQDPAQVQSIMQQLAGIQRKP